MSRREPPFKPGEKFQNYQLRRLIGSGGQGFVYEAYDEHLDHVLAVKIVPTNTERASDLKQRARMEARILFRVRHRNIVEFHNAAATDDGMVWIAMELLSGRPLRAVLNELKRLQIDEALLVGTQIAEGMQAAHAKQAIHRDLKPDNVFVEPGNVIKILDFGIAKITGLGAVTTQQNIIQGTLQYMSPEHLQGRTVTEQSDIFALGCILYELIAGCAPALVGMQHRHQELTGWAQISRMPPRLDKLSAHVPAAVAHAVQRMLAKEPANRPPTMEQVARELKTLQSRYARMGADPPRELWHSNLQPRQPALGPEPPPNTTEPDATCGHFEDSVQPKPIGPAPAEKTEPLPLLTRSAPPAPREDSTPVAPAIQPARRSVVVRAPLIAAATPVTITARHKNALLPPIGALQWTMAALLGVAIGVGVLIHQRKGPHLSVAAATARSTHDTIQRQPAPETNEQHQPPEPTLVASTHEGEAPLAVASVTQAAVAPSVEARATPTPHEQFEPIASSGANAPVTKATGRKPKPHAPEPPFKLDDMVF